MLKEIKEIVLSHSNYNVMYDTLIGINNNSKFGVLIALNNFKLPGEVKSEILNIKERQLIPIIIEYNIIEIFCDDESNTSVWAELYPAEVEILFENCSVMI